MLRKKVRKKPGHAIEEMHNSLYDWESAFSYGKSQVDCVIEYIKKQEIHHRTRTFIEEYHDFLEKFEVDFDERYIFAPVEYIEE